jgi:hypothetical protein
MASNDSNDDDLIEKIDKPQQEKKEKRLSVREKLHNIYI